MDTLNDISQDLVEMLSGIEGTTEVTGGITEGGYGNPDRSG